MEGVGTEGQLEGCTISENTSVGLWACEGAAVTLTACTYVRSILFL